MEKFSAYRDPGTGIQPFLSPVPPLGSDSLLTNLSAPLRYPLAIIRTALILALTLLYILASTVSYVFAPFPPLRRLATRLILFFCGRTILFTLGLFWIPVENVTRKRGRPVKTAESWNPRAGDIIVSNWVSWIELIWLAFRFNPIFVLPVTNDLPPPPSTTSSPIANTPGRRTGTGSANISAPNRTSQVAIPIRGFQQVSLLSIIRSTGRVPLTVSLSETSPKSLEEIRKNASRPVVVFPECTTSNGRGVLRFSHIFHQDVPVKGYQVFLMCVRYDPPTSLTPTMTHSIPSRILNPLVHIFNLTTSLTPLAISIRLLAPSESPSSQLFVTSEVLSDSFSEDQLADTCATLISQLGKLRKTGMGWENKTNFLEFYWDKKRH
ncbi:hypothetical protein BDQ17DRAFT_1302802 [Cyathus striatus]|nr:hypothetical protein BDQ17DRAFT_1302802 [Cyathus striatus]